MSFTHDQLEETMRTAQSLLTCRTPTDMRNVYKQFMQQSFDRLLAEGNKMAQTTAHLAKETATPLKDRLESLMQGNIRTA